MRRRKCLTASIEGKRGMPRVKPTDSILEGLAKTNSIEQCRTYANVPMITKTVLTGTGASGGKQPGNQDILPFRYDPEHGLIEVPMGTKLGDVYLRHRRASRTTRNSKPYSWAVRPGGCLTKETWILVWILTPSKPGPSSGPAVWSLWDQHTCMVEVARFFMNFTQRELRQMRTMP